MFQIIGFLDVKKKGPAWLSQWTTGLDNTAENANKTLNFEGSVANLWDNSALREHRVAEFFIRVGEY